MLGDKIKQMRIGMQISQTNLAKKLGVSPQTVSKWENHISSPDISVLPQIARFFGISMDELFEYRTEGEHYKDEFVRFLFKNKMLQFGSFELKSGRISPYYVHCGLLNLSSRIASLGLFFAECMHENFLHTSCLVGFTPRETALAVATGIAFYQKFGVEVKCCTDIDVLRQMDADTPLCLITDTFTSGQTLCYELDFFKKKIGRIPKDVLVCVDRTEYSENSHITAKQKIELSYSVKIHAIVSFHDILSCLKREIIPQKTYYEAMLRYQKKYIGDI